MTVHKGGYLRGVGRGWATAEVTFRDWLPRQPDLGELDGLQDVDTVLGAGGHLGRHAGSVQPQGQAGMPQVAGAAGEWRSGQ